MLKNNTAPPHDARLGAILRDDIRRGDFRRTMRRDYSELKELFLDDIRKARLKEMSPLKQWLYTTWWLFKSLLRKLTPARRLLLVVAITLALLPQSIYYSGEHLRIHIETSVFAVVVILFILMLELKDKLLARDELEAGRAVQTSLMPDREPTIPGWSTWLFTRTANEVGGDLVDFQKLSPDRFLVSLADVAGKGLKAALLTAKLQATLRAIAPESPNLPGLGQKINHIFYRDSLRSTFASLVCVESSSGSSAVRILNAGHLPPILMREGIPGETRKGDPAIGILPDITCSEDVLELQKGDVLFLYSDGLTEAKNESGDFFGSRRLIGLLPFLAQSSAPEIGNRVLQEVDQFIGEGSMYDDLSIVVLKRIA